MVVPTVLATTARRNCVPWSDRDKGSVATSIVAMEASPLPTPLRLLSWAMPPRSIWREARRIPGDGRARRANAPIAHGAVRIGATEPRLARNNISSLRVGSALIRVIDWDE